MAKWTEIVKTGEIKCTIEFEDGSTLERIVKFEHAVLPRFVDVKCLKWFKKAIQRERLVLGAC